MAEVKDWYEDTFEPIDTIPADLTWDALFLALSSGKVQDVLPEPQAQERCIRRLSEICRVGFDRLIEVSKHA